MTSSSGTPERQAPVVAKPAGRTKEDVFALFDATDTLVLEGWLWKGKQRRPTYQQRRWFSNRTDVFTLSYYLNDKSTAARRGFIDMREVEAVRVTDFVDESWSLGGSARTSCEFQLFTKARLWVLSARGKESVVYWKDGLGRLTHFVSHPPSASPPVPSVEPPLRRAAATAAAAAAAMASPALSPTAAVVQVVGIAAPSSSASSSSTLPATPSPLQQSRLIQRKGRKAGTTKDDLEGFDDEIFKISEDAMSECDRLLPAPRDLSSYGSYTSSSYSSESEGELDEQAAALPPLAAPKKSVGVEPSPDSPVTSTSDGQQSAATASHAAGQKPAVRSERVFSNGTPPQDPAVAAAATAAAEAKRHPIPKISRTKLQRMSMMTLALLEQQSPGTGSPVLPGAAGPREPFKLASRALLPKTRTKVFVGASRIPPKSPPSSPTARSGPSPRPNPSPRTRLTSDGASRRPLPIPPPRRQSDAGGLSRSAPPVPSTRPKKPSIASPILPARPMEKPPERPKGSEPASPQQQQEQQPKHAVASAEPASIPEKPGSPVIELQQPTQSTSETVAITVTPISGTSTEPPPMLSANPLPEKQVEPEKQLAASDPTPAAPVLAPAPSSAPVPAPAPVASKPTDQDGAPAPPAAPAKAKTQTEIEEEKKRTKQIDEVCLQLVKQEMEYSGSLQVIVNNYLLPLRRDDTLFSRIYKADMEIMFSNIEIISNLHLRVAASLLEASKHTRAAASLTPTQIILRMFVLEEEMREAYREYVRNYGQAMETLAQCLKSKHVRQFFNVCKGKSKGQELAVLLALPLERISAYDSAFERIIELQGREAGENELMYHEFVHDLSEFVVDLHSRYQLSRVEHLFKGLTESLAEKLFLRSGPLLLLSKTLRLSRGEFIVWLFSDALFVTKKSMGKYAVVQRVETAVIAEVVAPAQKPCSFKLVMSSDTFEGLVFTCASPDDRAAWVGAFKYARKRSTDTQLFRVDITALMQRKSERGHSVPHIVHETCRRLLPGSDTGESLGLPGTLPADFAELKSLLNRGAPVDWTSVPVHLVPELLKYWLRKLPSPVVPFHLYRNFAGANTAEELHQACAELPSFHQAVLFHLIETFVKACGLAEEAAPGAGDQAKHRIASSFGPCILRTRDTQRHNPRFSRYTATGNEAMAPRVIIGLIEGFGPIFRDVRLNISRLESEIASREELTKQRVATLRSSLRKQSRAAVSTPAVTASILALVPQAAPPPGTSISPLPTETADSLHHKVASIALGDIVRQGWLERAEGRAWQQRWFVLVRGRLYVFKSDRDRKPIDVIDLIQRYVTPDNSRPFAMIIFGPPGVPTVTACGSSEEDRAAWAKSISACVEGEFRPHHPPASAAASTSAHAPASSASPTV